jgi:hypothetical protein
MGIPAVEITKVAATANNRKRFFEAFDRETRGRGSVIYE